MKRILIRSLLYKLILSGFLVFAVYFFLWGEFGIVRHYHVQQELYQKQQELLVLKKDLKGIEQELEKWKNDPFYLEKMAREELGMGRKDEVVYIYKA